MAAGDGYRIKAVEFEVKAETETNDFQRLEFEALARAYRRLARQAQQNSALDIVYETPPDRDIA
jgi:hypothetical protein